MEPTKSPQYERTHRAICNALVELLKDKPFEKITVQNILDATPVTRTTFYKHFHDKYEIAEEMQEQYIGNLNQMLQKLEQANIHEFHKVMAEHYRHHVEQVRALSKINTERVNLREIISASFKCVFDKNDTIAPGGVEAKVYADTMASFMMNSIEVNVEQVDMRQYYNEVMITVVLALLSLDEDEEARRFLFDKVNHLR